MNFLTTLDVALDDVIVTTHGKSDIGLTLETAPLTEAVDMRNLPIVAVTGTPRSGHGIDQRTDPTVIADEAEIAPLQIAIKALDAPISIEAQAVIPLTVSIKRDIIIGARARTAERKEVVIPGMTTAVVGVVATTVRSIAWPRIPTSRRRTQTLPRSKRKKMRMLMSSGTVSSGCPVNARRPTSIRCRSI